jgi:hypothetical protein
MPSEIKNCKFFMRWLGLFLLIAFLIIMTGLIEGYKTRRGGIWESVASTNIACVVTLMITIIPIACHEGAKYIVRMICILLFFLVSMLVYAFGNLDSAISLFLGSIYGASLWYLELHVCTNVYREDCKNIIDRMHPTLAKCIMFSCFCNGEVPISDEDESLDKDELLDEGEALIRTSHSQFRGAKIGINSS